jgi:putative SOS response-associated peptidase YedK
LLTAAGVWDEWKDRATGEPLKSCTMIVGESNDFAAEIHDRMPVFLTEEQFSPWLTVETGAEHNVGQCRSGSIAPRQKRMMRL